LDPFIVDDVRNFLFANMGPGFDLALLNIQRGRDHGLSSYNDTREAFGLGRAQDFSDISSNQDIQDRLASIYASVDDVDLWVGALSEDPVPGGHVGALIRATLKRQFEALRDGDRFWYKRNFSRHEIEELENTKLSDIIRRNTTIGNEISDNVFSVNRRIKNDPHRIIGSNDTIKSRQRDVHSSVATSPDDAKASLTGRMSHRPVKRDGR
jgi:hypothetical protein